MYTSTNIRQSWKREQISAKHENNFQTNEIQT